MKFDLLSVDFFFFLGERKHGAQCFCSFFSVVILFHPNVTVTLDRALKQYMYYINKSVAIRIHAFLWI